MQCTKRVQEVEKNIYDINGFQIRFFTRSDVEDILMVTGFTANKIIEAYEAPASLYCVFTRKVSK